jgi:serine/threonine protein kinase
MGDSDETPLPIPIGGMIGDKYRVDSVLGVGGMGVVVAATHTTLGQRVAIKFLLPDALKSKEIVTRFEREARAAVKIHSEHVARVIDVGELPSGAPYMVMEYLEGKDLAHRIAAGPLPLDEAVRYILETCEALADAHAAGIVHRDIKPTNLFLAKRTDKTVSVKVLDFGISKIVDGAIKGRITSAQSVMGSPCYMSPEQLRDPTSVDHRADIWALGIVLYEALTGTPPFVNDLVAQIITQVLDGKTPRASQARPEVPAAVDNIIARCLAKQPSDRYHDIGELAAALAPFSSDGARTLERIDRILDRNLTAEQRLAVSTALRAAPTVVPVAALSTSPGWGSGDVVVPKRSMRGVMGLVAVLALAGGIAFVATRHRTTAAGNVATTTAAATSSEPANKTAAPSIPTSQSAPSATASTVQAPKPVQTPRARPRPSPSANACDPNYTLDDQGRKHFKPECFQ